MSFEQIWFGTRAVSFDQGEAATATGAQAELITSNAQFATISGSFGVNDRPMSAIQYQQLLAFTGTAVAQGEIGINLADGVDAPLAGQVNSTGDLRVGGSIDGGVSAYNLSDMLGGLRVSDISGLSDADDPVVITGLGRANNNILAASNSGGTTGNFVAFSNDTGFGFLNLSGAETVSNAARLNDGDSVNFAVMQGKHLALASFTVRIANGGSAEVVLDSDGQTIRDSNGGAAGGFVQDASAGELNLGSVTDGTRVVIDFMAGTISLGGSLFAGDAATFFAEFALNGHNQLTLGSTVANSGAPAAPTIGWSADNLVLTMGDAELVAPAMTEPEVGLQATPVPGSGDLLF